MWNTIYKRAERDYRKASKTLKILEVDDIPNEKAERKAKNEIQESKEIMDFCLQRMKPLPGTYDPWEDPKYNWGGSNR